MHTEIALSSAKAEYIALSQSTRDLIPILELVKEIGNVLIVNNKTINTYSTIFKDNKGALQLVNEPRYRLRTIYIVVKYYYFRYFIK